MEDLTNILADVEDRREAFAGELDDINGTAMAAVADHDDVLSDDNIDVIVHTSTLASKLFTLAHDLALGLRVDGPITQRRVQEALAGLSELADKAFSSEDEDDDAAWDRA